MKKLLLLLLSFQLFALDESASLLEDLDYASKISTKTKLNSNKTPAVVSVLYGKELQKLGITDIYTALETLPGIEISMGIAGAKQINMRGNKTLVTDKLKFMVDGISINTQLSGANHFYLNMPIENIDRIEIIRGPASALYGSFANIGLINVITKASTHKSGGVFVRASSEGSKNIGFTQHFNSENMKLALQGSYQKNDKSREYDSYSLLGSQNSYLSYEDFQDKELALDLEFMQDFHFISKYLQLTTQNYFGYGAWPIVQDPKRLQHSSFVNELSYAPQLNRELSLGLKLGYKEYGMKGDSRLNPTTLRYGLPYDTIGYGDYKEEEYYSDISLNYTDTMHSLVTGVHLSKAKVKNVTYSLNNPLVSEETNIEVSGGGLKDGIERTHYALYASDFITLSEYWIANIGLRYDNYSDVGSALSPKLALLYIYSQEQSYKLMYQNSFRAPTFVELYGTQVPFIGDEQLESETIDTLELAYRYQSSFEQWFNLNVFYSKKKNSIYRDASYKIKNGEPNHSYGVELEFKIPLQNSLSLEANYSYISSKDSDGKQTPLIAKELANMMLMFDIGKGWNTASRIRYVGEHSREKGDVRAPLKPYTTFDQTLTYSFEEFTVQATLKNIFKEKVTYTTPMGNEVSSGTYINDLNRDSRVFWLGMEYTFR